MITEQNTIIELSISADSENEPVFSYSINGAECTGNVIMKEGGTITYQIVEVASVFGELKFIGAGFVTPFDGVVDEVAISNDGKEIYLSDLDHSVGTTSFRLILSNSINSLSLISPDPQVINRPK
ncbi:DP-EP family protein [Shewanella sp.]|uniref:DP-EP family protein n=1 Tax=Shewanella sp. TaxID=50422 RepID=UPI003A97AD91